MDRDEPVHRFNDYYANRVQKQTDEGFIAHSRLQDRDEQLLNRNPKWSSINTPLNYSRDSVESLMAKQAILDHAREIIQEEREKLLLLKYEGRRRGDFDGPMMEPYELFDEEERSAIRSSYSDGRSYDIESPLEHSYSKSGRRASDTFSSHQDREVSGMSYGGQGKGASGMSFVGQDKRAFGRSSVGKGRGVLGFSPVEEGKGALGLSSVGQGKGARGMSFVGKGKGTLGLSSVQQGRGVPNLSSIGQGREALGLSSIRQGREAHGLSSIGQGRGALGLSSIGQCRGALGLSSVGEDSIYIDDYPPSKIPKNETSWWNREIDFSEEEQSMGRKSLNQNIFSSSNRQIDWDRRHEQDFFDTHNQIGSRNFGQEWQGRKLGRGRGQMQRNVTFKMQEMDRVGVYPQSMSKKRSFEKFLKNSDGWPTFPNMQDLSMKSVLDQDLIHRHANFQEHFFKSEREFEERRNKSAKSQKTLNFPVIKKSRNLYFRNILKKFTDQDLAEYFNLYGQVRVVRFDRDRNGKTLQRGVVTFMEPYMAEYAFSRAPHFINGDRIRVSLIRRKKKKKKSGTSTSQSASNNDTSSGNTTKKTKGKSKPPVHTNMTECEKRQKKLSLMLKKQNKKECVKPAIDPHVLCVFCESLRMNVLYCCYKKGCVECNSLKGKQRSLLKREWTEQGKNTAHPCYWNMAPLQSITLQPWNVSAKSAICGICSETFEIEDKMNHLKEKKHATTVTNRKYVNLPTFTALYKRYIQLCNQEQKTGKATPFCKGCFLRSRCGRQHKTINFHKMVVRYRKAKCDVCDVGVVDYEKHTYTYSHLRNVWHQKVMSGEGTPSEDSKYIGEDFVKHTEVFWCSVCKVFLETNGEVIMEHCKSKGHYENAKRRAEKSARKDNAACPKEESMPKKQAPRKKREQEGIDKKGNTPKENDDVINDKRVEDVSLNEEAIEDDISLNVEAVEDDVSLNEEAIENDAAMEVDED